MSHRHLQREGETERDRERQRKRKVIVFNQKVNRNMKDVVRNIISYNQYIHTTLLTLNNMMKIIEQDNIHIP